MLNKLDQTLGSAQLVKVKYISEGELLEDFITVTIVLEDNALKVRYLNIDSVTVAVFTLYHYITELLTTCPEYNYQGVKYTVIDSDNEIIHLIRDICN